MAKAMALASYEVALPHATICSMVGVWFGRKTMQATLDLVPLHLENHSFVLAPDYI